MIFELKANVKFIDAENAEVTRLPGDIFCSADKERVRRGVKAGYFALRRICHSDKITDADSDKINTAFFCGEVANIGGIETALVNTGDWFSEESLTFVASSVDFEMALRLARHHNVIVDNGSDSYSCNTAIYSSFDAPKIFRNRIYAKKHYFVVHADWAALKKYSRWKDYTINDKEFDKIIAVSGTAKKGLLTAFEKPVKSIVVQNPPAVEAPQRALTILTLSRGTREKGMSRVYCAAKKLQDAGLPYLWIIAGTQSDPLITSQLRELSGVVFMPANANNRSLIKAVDYVAQLSDTESYCYTAHEALAAGVPVIATRIPELEKIIKHGENGYLFNLDMEDFSPETVYSEVPKFEPIKEKLDPKMKKMIKGEL